VNGNLQGAEIHSAFYSSTGLGRLLEAAQQHAKRSVSALPEIYWPYLVVLFSYCTGLIWPYHKVLVMSSVSEASCLKLQQHARQLIGFRQGSA
jgi:hypothetical protein